MINIGWIIDSKYRELSRLYSLKKRLEKKKVKLVFFNKLNFELGIKSYSLSALIIPNLWEIGLKMVDIAKHLDVPKIYVYHTECFEESENYLKLKYPISKLKNINSIFCHTKIECEFLKKNNFENYKFVGHYKYFNSKKNSQRERNQKKIIGLTSTNKYLANPHTNSLIHIINRRCEDEFARDYLKYEIDYIFLLTKLIKFCKNNNFKILFRPHPLEQNNRYDLLKNDFFEVDYSYDIKKFFGKIDVLLNHISSSSFDAIMNDVPVINICNLFEDLKNFQDLYEFPPAQIGKKIEKFEDIKSILENDKNLENLVYENKFLKNEIIEKIFNKNQDPLTILESLLSNEQTSPKILRKLVFFPVFFFKQILTNLKNNRYELFNSFNFKDSKLLKKMDEKS